MYTQCPSCKTVFRLPPELLNAAQGQVRCSRCRTVFNGLEHLFRQHVDETDTSTLASETGEQVDWPAGPRPVHEAALQYRDAARGPGPEEAGFGAIAEEAAVTSDEAPEEEPPLADTSPLPDEEAQSESLQEAAPPVEAPPQSVGEPLSWQFPVESAAPDAPEEEPPTEEADESAAIAPPAPLSGVGQTLDLFAEAAEETPHALDATEPAGQQYTDEEAPPVEPDVAVAATLAGEAFDEALLAIFAPQEAPPVTAPGSKESTVMAGGADDEGYLPQEENIMAEVGMAASSSLAEILEAHAPEFPSASAENLPTVGETGCEEEPPVATARGDEPPTLEAVAEGEEIPEWPPTEEVADKALFEGSEPQQGDPGAEQAPDGAPPPSRPAGERPGYSLPLEQEAARPGLFGTLLWGGGIALLLAGLVLQYLYYHRMALAENATLRPLLSQMCELTGCRLPPRRELGKIVLGNHLVQSHPRYENSLLITATLVNRADFSQPYPIVEVVMTDLGQRVVARRRFLPGEYLVGNSDPDGLNPGSEVPLMLEVVDPGKNAVGFEFNFY
jgi:predicted Zn finger-like uncharacterized protein